MAVYTFDFDGTLNRHPERFAPLVTAITASGHRAAVVTSRESDRGIAEYLEARRFPKMEIHAREQSIWPGPIWKARKVESLGASMHFDNDSTVRPAGIPVMLVSSGDSPYGKVASRKM